MKNSARIYAEYDVDSSRHPASREYISNVEYQLYARQESTPLEAAEIDIVNDFSLQGFSAAACAQYIKRQRGRST